MADDAGPGNDTGRAAGSGRPRQDIRGWCDRSTIPAAMPELSDSAAILIAAGYLTPAGRTIVVRRISTGAPMPSLATGFGELRRLQRSITAAETQAGNDMLPNMVAAVVRARVSSLVRKRDEARRAVVTGKGIFPSGTRAIRRERRENIYLEIEERERLFAGLLCTPTPNVTSGGGMLRAGGAALDRIAGAVGAFAGRATGSAEAEKWANQILGQPDPAEPLPEKGESRFVDAYETMLFVAGHFYDRIRSNPAWLSDHFEMQRSQVNLHNELTEIAADVITLRSLRVELDRAREAGGFDPAFAEHITKREAALRPVWAELLDRVQALADVNEVVESAAVELRVLAEYGRAATIDERIDHLIAGSGLREISADNTRRLREQVSSGEEQLRIYRDVLQGDIARISPAVSRQLPDRYEPS